MPSGRMVSPSSMYDAEQKKFIKFKYKSIEIFIEEEFLGKQNPVFKIMDFRKFRLDISDRQITINSLYQKTQINPTVGKNQLDAG